jgi:hypothetical protein
MRSEQLEVKIKKRRKKRRIDTHRRNRNIERG